MWKLRDGSDAAVFANGVMVSRALEAAEALAKEGVSVRVLNVSTIKPLDRDAIIGHAEGVRAIVTAEEANIIGGLGRRWSRRCGVCGTRPVDFVGVQDSFGASAENHDILLNHYGLTTRAVTEAVRRLLATA